MKLPDKIVPIIYLMGSILFALGSLLTILKKEGS